MELKKEQLNLVIQKISDVSELLYQQKIMDAMEQLNDLLGEISVVLDGLCRYGVKHEGFEFDQNRVMGSLQEAIQMMETKDYVMLADIFQYDLVEYLRELMDGIE